MEKIHKSTLERIRFSQGELRAFLRGPGPSRVSIGSSKLENFVTNFTTLQPAT